ncbi:MAG TPA: site-specific integrase, partial [Candidatus Nanoarchaeia archaeon]|nr:site-specific integrase [Candidatus Nanoarchaeia archaeon]
NNKLSEQMHKKSALNAHLIPFFGKFLISEITNQRVEEFKAAKLKSKLKAKTINNLTSILAKCLRSAVEWEIVDKIPRIQKLKVPPYKYDFLTETEENILISSAHGVWREMLTVAVDTGLRLGELAALDWPSINFAKNEIIVRRSFTVKQMSAPKSNRERRIPITNRVCQMLQSKSEGIGLIFTIEPGMPLLQNRCRNNLLRICKKAGLRPLIWHTLRHTFATRLVSHGASIKALQELMGHSDIQTTMRYAHLECNVLNDTIDILNKIQTFGQQVVNTPQKQKINAAHSRQ